MSKWNFKLKTQYHLHKHPPPKMKYLGINLTQRVQYKIYMRKTSKL